MPSQRHLEEAHRIVLSGFGQTITFAIEYITALRAQIQATNATEVEMMEGKYHALLARWKHVVRQEAVQAQRYIQTATGGFGRWSLTIAVAAMVGGLAVALLTALDFDLGWAAYVWCAALCSATPWALAWFLNEYPSRTTQRMVGVPAVITLLFVSYQFGGVRGNVFQRATKQEAPVLLDVTADAELPPADREDEDLLADFGLVWAWSAVGLELIGGLALHRYLESRRSAGWDDLRKLQKEGKQLETEMRAVLARRNELRSEPARVAAEFWAAFDRGEAEARKRMNAARRIAVIVGVIALAASSAEGADRLHIVAMLDLSLTEMAAGASGPEFTANLAAISAVFPGLPTGTRTTVAAITGTTFTTPYVLLDGRTPADAGPFEIRLNQARRTLLSAWMRRTKGLRSTHTHTDVVGAFLFAADVFGQGGAERKALLLLSDGRNYTSDLDIEKPVRIDVAASLAKVEKSGITADLRDVEVYMVGAGDHSGVRGAAYTSDLKRFYTALIERWGGTLMLFSTTRENAALDDILKSRRVGRTR